MRRNEVAAVWALLGIVAIAVVVTYARLPADELYHVSRTGLSGGLGRLLVELSFPDAIIALGILAVIARGVPRRFRLVAFAAAALCLVTVVPGVVDQADLDARPVNVLPAVGVAIVLALSFAAALGPAVARARGDGVRVVLGALAIMLAIPWIAAELGFFLDGVPLLGWLFQTGRIVSFHGNEPHPAVHHGIHHGLHGLLFVLAALLLSRRLSEAPKWAAPLLALMLAYGFGNIVNDDWLEQIAERGWVDGTYPSVLEPALNWGWLTVLIGAAAVWALWFRQASGPTTATALTRARATKPT
jgi:hypothetical protein